MTDINPASIMVYEAWERDSDGRYTVIRYCLDHVGAMIVLEQLYGCVFPITPMTFLSVQDQKREDLLEAL
jgi:hypothetical protein